MRASARAGRSGARLPEAHTDFIFAVLGEELGLVGTLLVIGLFLAIAYATLRIALQTKDPFVRYCSFGIVIWLLGQMMINVGMVLALLPVIGIPLPLVSYGGSSLLPTLIAARPRGRLRPPRARGRPRAGPAASYPCGRAPPQDRRPVGPSVALTIDAVLFAGGGTAGHTSPLLATADALVRTRPGDRDHLPRHAPRPREHRGAGGRATRSS